MARSSCSSSARPRRAASSRGFGGVAAAVASDPGKSTRGTIPDPTNPNPVPPIVDPPTPDEDTDQVETDPDGTRSGSTVVPPPGVPGSPRVVISDEPEDLATPSISGISPAQGPSQRRDARRHRGHRPGGHPVLERHAARRRSARAAAAGRSSPRPAAPSRPPSRCDSSRTTAAATRRRSPTWPRSPRRAGRVMRRRAVR